MAKICINCLNPIDFCDLVCKNCGIEGNYILLVGLSYSDILNMDCYLKKIIHIEIVKDSKIIHSNVPVDFKW